MIEPIRLTFEVDCPVEHAFEVWTARIAQWWPRDHTVSAEEDLTVVLEGRRGGRIFERRTSGVEHDWGEVTIWEPPRRLGYTWHLNRDRSDERGDRAPRLGTARCRRRALAQSESRRLGDVAAALRRRRCRTIRPLTRRVPRRRDGWARRS